MPKPGRGPTAVAPERSEDPDGWHDPTTARVGGVRRRRRMDLWRQDGSLRADGWFRDAHCDATGRETVIHEYRLDARIDADTLCVSDLIATPLILPSSDCPVAADSASRLIGMPLEEVRSFVRREFRGVATCTHLNDALRAMGDLWSLADRIRS